MPAATTPDPPPRAPGPAEGPDGPAASRRVRFDPAERERLTRKLADARGTKGVSLWKDAWRRLAKNRPAMAAMAFLVLLGLTAVLTPVLPLQSPIAQHLRDRSTLPPGVAPVSMGWSAYVDREAAAERAVATATTDDARTQAKAALAEVRRQNPITTDWHEPGPLTKAMIRLRFALFGDWSVPSLMGTDTLGQDLLARILWGARVSLTVGIVATLVSLTIGVTWGAVAAYAGGVVDQAMMRIVDILYSIPFIFIVIFLMAILGDEEVKRAMEGWPINRLAIFYLVIGAIYWLTMSRVVRGQILSLKHEQFVDAARVVGASPARIIARHLIPNVMGVVVVYLTLTIPAVMLFEAFLSFLGMGVEAPDVSWGNLVDEGLKEVNMLQMNWWLVVFPGLALASTLFALNVLGDGLRDALDPRLRGR